MAIKPRLKRIFIIVFTILTGVGCDQATKMAAKHYLAAVPLLSYWGDFFRLHYVENTGAFLGFGSGLPFGFRFWVLIVLVGCVLAGLLFYLLVQQDLRLGSVIGLALIIAGGTGNLVDRILNNGEVIDFMNMGINGLRTGIFNVADLNISIGIGLVILYGFVHEKQNDPIEQKAAL
jgi:signal peptidase II